MLRTGTGIECVIARGKHVLLPVGAIEQFIEYEVASLPLARPFVGGVGVYDNALVVSVSLSDDLAACAGSRKGALLAPLRGGSKLRWAIELSHALLVTNVVSIDEMGSDGDESAPSRAHDTSSWLKSALLEDGRKLPWLDVERLLQAVGAC